MIYCLNERTISPNVVQSADKIKYLGGGDKKVCRMKSANV